MPTLSVVLPVYNERENLEPLFQRLMPVLENATNGSFEVLFVNDGSRDDSGEMLAWLHSRDCRVKVLHFSRNFGQQAALQAGLDAASGQAVALMDADLQDPPELLPLLLERWKEGYDVVYAIRKKRKEGLFKRAAYALFYRTLKLISEIDVPLDAGDFCLLDRRVVDALVSLREQSRFLRGLRSWVGFKQIGIEYERDPRNTGEPKYKLSNLVRLAVSGYVGFSAMPLRLASWLGFLTAGIGFLTLLWAIYTKLFGLVSPRGWASTIGVVLFVGGTELLVLGVIGEYLGRMYDEVRGRPLYIISSGLGFDEDNDVSPLGRGRSRPAGTAAQNRLS
jgi:polyisoprenyl-phosphate glycosyltransferase